MKYLWIGLIMICTVYVLTLVNYYVIKGNLEGLDEQLCIAEEAIANDDVQSALDAALRATELWHSKEQYYLAVLRHSSVENISELLTLVMRGLEFGSTGVKDAIIDARAGIETLIEGEAMSIGNVL